MIYSPKNSGKYTLSVDCGSLVEVGVVYDLVRLCSHQHRSQHNAQCEHLHFNANWNAIPIADNDELKAQFTQRNFWLSTGDRTTSTECQGELQGSKYGEPSRASDVEKISRSNPDPATRREEEQPRAQHILSCGRETVTGRGN